MEGGRRSDERGMRMEGGGREEGEGGRRMEEEGRRVEEGGRKEGGGGKEQRGGRMRGGEGGRKLNFFYLNEFFRIFMVVDMLAVGQGLDLLSPYNVIKLGSRSVGLKLLLFFIK